MTEQMGQVDARTGGSGQYQNRWDRWVPEKVVQVCARTGGTGGCQNRCDRLVPIHMGARTGGTVGARIYGTDGCQNRWDRWVPEQEAQIGQERHSRLNVAVR